MAGSAGTETYNAAGNSDFSRKTMELANNMLERWEAPSVRWTGPSASDGARGGQLTEAMSGSSLVQQVNSLVWSSPRTITGGGESAERKQELGRTESGGGDLQSQAAMWAGQLAQNHKGSGTAIHRPDNGKLRDDMLHFQAEQFFRPPSSPARPIAGGSTSSTDSPNSNQPSLKRKLNPIFVEALMRWPTGLSGFERQEMAWTRWWLLMPSFLSALVSQETQSQPAQGSLF